MVELRRFFANDESIPWPEFVSKSLHKAENNKQKIDQKIVQLCNIYLEKMNRSSRARPPVNLAANLLPIVITCNESIGVN